MRDAPSPRLAAFDTAGQLSTSRVARCMPCVIRCAAYRAEAERLAVRLRPDAGGPCARCAPDAVAGGVSECGAARLICSFEAQADLRR